MGLDERFYVAIELQCHDRDDGMQLIPPVEWTTRLSSQRRRRKVHRQGLRERREPAVGGGGQRGFCLGREIAASRLTEVHYGRTRKHCQLYRSCEDLDNKRLVLH